MLRAYTTRNILSRIYLTSYIPIANIPVVDTEGYWLWNSENFAAWNLRQPALSGNLTDGGGFPRKPEPESTGFNWQRNLQPANARTSRLAESDENTFSLLRSLVGARKTRTAP